MTTVTTVAGTRLWQRWSRRYSESPAGAIYGTIVTAAIVAAESISDLAVTRVVETIAVALPLYWLAHAYAELLANRMHDTTRPLWRDAGRALLEESTVVESALPPVVVLIVLRAAGASPGTTLNACLWLCVFDLFTFGWIAASRSRLRGLERLLYAVVTAAFGGAIVALKALLH